ncbi:fungal-specific transcription factor domain-containing protein [Bisporella sp. PMI_857]|nr:fungal-specific transcription factor domain-containing protein [Bisporella sp. PMI_857]
MVSLRSTRGCWTCRVRRKKCDEMRPICKLCQSLRITCHGYSDNRPEWMDNEDDKKAVIGNLKRSVRLSTRHRKTLQKLTPVTLHSPFTTCSSQPLSHGNHALGFQGSDPDNFSNANKPVLEVCPVRLGREPGLIMHFFDHVFPIQHPCYRSLIEEGGRGWYLSLILSNKALYHAVLCLSAYHRYMTMRQRGATCHELALQDQETHNALSFKVLQQQLQGDAKSAGLKERIGMLAGIIQMMYFQLLFFNDEQWKIHLEILIVMINDIHEDVLKVVHSSGPSVFTCDEPPAFAFFCGFLIWADLQSSISIGKAPQLSKLHDQVLKELPAFFRLQHIIGCESWVLQIISKIANIREWKANQGIISKINTTKLRRKSDQITDDLDQGLRRIEKELQHTLNLPNRSPLETTQIFALAAKTFLHITISGPQSDLVEIQTSVCRTIHALKQLKDENQLKILPWPLYLTGCMAMGQDREYILDSFNTIHILYSGACNQDRYSQMLKRYWAIKETKQDCDIWDTGSGRPLFI